MNREKELKAVIIGGFSALMNNNGNIACVTINGYGSCTPLDILQKWVDGMDTKERNKWYGICDETKDQDGNWNI